MVNAPAQLSPADVWMSGCRFPHRQDGRPFIVLRVHRSFNCARNSISRHPRWVIGPSERSGALSAHRHVLATRQLQPMHHRPRARLKRMNAGDRAGASLGTQPQCATVATLFQPLDNTLVGKLGQLERRMKPSRLSQFSTLRGIRSGEAFTRPADPCVSLRGFRPLGNWWCGYSRKQFLTRARPGLWKNRRR